MGNPWPRFPFADPARDQRLRRPQDRPSSNQH
jgi:hypothetical protein